MNIEKITFLINKYFANISFEDRIHSLNEIRKTLSQHSPFQHHPIDSVEWVKMSDIELNNYNPNKISPYEFTLLRVSLLRNGYTQPVIVHEENNKYIVIDGEHRFRLGMETPELQQSLHGYIPVAKISNVHLQDRMAATIRHNRARGLNSVQGMTEIVVSLSNKGWDDEKISSELGMEQDEILRLKQLSGLEELFRNEEYTEAWTIT
ncbi:ParB N-terminal domain-containing protein [Erwinia sp. ErVv1]|uniref:ParB N-terminal domain-containing protein n=1 Tax=Erwinia sp. ErVv1 TaxID=1603299 RepID=UPI0008323705|nr:ParB N-terminal domain-containing protein [Erwinia sp. ErVv1]